MRFCYPPHLSYYLNKPYNVGTQIDRLIKTLPFSTHNIGVYGTLWIREHVKRPLCARQLVCRSLDNVNTSSIYEQARHNRPECR